MHSSIFMDMKTPSITIQGNITAMKYRIDFNAVGSSSSYPCQSRYDVCMGLCIMSCCQKHSSNARSKQHAKSLDLNPIDHLLDLLKCKACAQQLQLNLRELTRVIQQMCAAIPQQYIHRHMLSMSTRYLAVDVTPGGCTKYQNEIRYDVI